VELLKKHRKPVKTAAAWQAIFLRVVLLSFIGSGGLIFAQQVAHNL